MKKEKATPKSSPKQSSNNGNSTNAQRQRVLTALAGAGSEGLTTIQLREDYDIMAPAPRIYELRWNHGFNIHLIWDRAKNAQGNEHSCGRYVLLPGQWEGRLSA